MYKPILIMIKNMFLMCYFSLFTNKLAVTLIFLFASFGARAQSKMIKNAFKLLPASLVYGLSDAAKDSMLKGKTYYPSDNDSESILSYNYGKSKFVNDYMYISMSYETAQRATGMIELRAFEMKDTKLIIVSNTGGVEGVNYQQNDISVFIYDLNSKLSPYKAKIFPDWSVNLILKSGTPDSIKKVIENNSNLTFDFSRKNVALSLNSPFLISNQEYRKWLKGDQIIYTWNGKQFIGGLISFSE